MSPQGTDLWCMIHYLLLLCTSAYTLVMLAFVLGVPGWWSSKVFVATTDQQEEMPNRPVYLGAVLGLTLFGGLACFVGLLVPLIASSGVRKISYQQLERLLLVLGVIVISLMPFNNILRDWCIWVHSMGFAVVHA